MGDAYAYGGGEGESFAEASVAGGQGGEGDLGVCGWFATVEGANLCVDCLEERDQ